ncbi:hypothetical protein [Streptomyces luteolus]|uniref:Uncharacterized protein n=1 Tax=Streptomyces luteolus TaxID=3043615 RepID=A0ABT6T7T0_9ACTN|nr:hypothetical protein [Streptomyces sp. B-S-A12]MDI3423930.1 hypothetical protein [Streptomyces sp. B-S-A12]
MSQQLRRLAAVSLMALALTAGGATAATTASAASPQPAQTGAYPDPGSLNSYSGHHDGDPLRFGPFDVPRNGTISGGLSWNVRD